jgi:hypothetical protein
MKKTFLVTIVTALLTWITFSVFQSLHKGVERLWLVSAIKVPGNKAIADIQSNMNEGRYKLAAAKLQALKDTWQRFDTGPDSFSGRGIGDIMVTFSKLDTDYATNIPEQNPSTHH